MNVSSTHMRVKGVVFKPLLDRRLCLITSSRTLVTRNNLGAPAPQLFACENQCPLADYVVHNKRTLGTTDIQH
jgi:hypothetical protein